MMGPKGALERARDEVRQRLTKAAKDLSSEGLPLPALDGKLLRPLTAYVMVPQALRPQLDERFWYGALAIEMVHEASLLHDDILDGAPQRRGRPTMVATAGTGPALVYGDHLLTGAYRAAAATDSPEFLGVFIRSVERTVAGEIAQERNQGRILSEPEYLQAITGKSGELFRSAFALAPALLGAGSPESIGEEGARFGALYQMVDDFLDYCAAADRGKPPLQDYRQKKWTWPLGLIHASDFEADESEVISLLFKRPSSMEPSPMEEGVQELKSRFDRLIESLSQEEAGTAELQELLQDWIVAVHRATEKEVASGNDQRFQRWESPSPGHQGSLVEWPRTAVMRRELRIAAEGLDSPDGRLGYFGKHAKTFRFAARLFPRDQLQKVAGVYAFCRFTDDLVDEAGEEPPETTEARLKLWMSMARKAYDGEKTGIPLLDGVMREMADSGVPFSYAQELGEGVRMDLRKVRFETMEELRGYSYRVASVVGGWLTELFGIRDPWVLDRAFALGHAMQVTNILRDVGEDLGMDRLYLPEELMKIYGVDRELLEVKVKNRSAVFGGYQRLLEVMMEEAEADYERAFEAIPFLPDFFRAPVAVAASVYRGIHQEIRRNGFNNLTLRASVSPPRKIVLALQGLWELRKARTHQRQMGAERPLLIPSFGDDEERQAVT